MNPNDLVGLLLGGGTLLLLVVLALVLLSGRGSSLIAGYNTMSQEEKSRYNAKALGRAIGVYLLALSALLAALIYLGMTGASAGIIWAATGGILVLTVVFLIYINTSRRFRSK